MVDCSPCRAAGWLRCVASVRPCMTVDLLLPGHSRRCGRQPGLGWGAWWVSHTAANPAGGTTQGFARKVGIQHQAAHSSLGSLAHIVCESSDSCNQEVHPEVLRCWFQGRSVLGLSQHPAGLRLSGRAQHCGGGRGVQYGFCGSVCIGEAHSAHSLPNSTLT